ncbi:flagellar hook-length control protein FliK [Roseburia hominis]|uniref:flagellar hook-length control protein FliK n=1 Tax=Roseburia hominis TaxID=301301 RepID=UPI001F33560E|nr:flagellar hook-length control protein FliK [Roseburia hominis]
MQISDFFGQYDLNTNANTKGEDAVAANTQTSAAKELSAVLRNLFAGDIFEATVNEIKNSEVTLGLSDGQTILARLQGQVQLQVGEAMFFQVKSNQGMQMEIKPFPMGAEGNPTLLKALDAAGLKVTEQNLSMVHSMMEQQLPIDKESLLHMVRLSGSHPSIPRSTLVEMTKYEIPVTEENATVFENYKMDQGKVEPKLEQLFRDLPQKLADDSMTVKQVAEFHNRLVSILTGEEQELVGQKEGLQEQNFSAENTGENQVNDTTRQAVELQKQGENQSGQAVMEEQQKAQEVQTEVKTVSHVQQEVVQTAESQTAGKAENTPFTQNEAQLPLLSHTMTKPELAELNQALETFTGKPTDASEMTAKQLLQMVKDFLSGEKLMPEENIRNLFSKKSYQQVLRHALEAEWLLNPKDLTDSEKMRNFYTKMDKQMGQISELLSQNTQTMGKPMQTLSDVQNNLQFMHVLNQTYTYMQIPLKMSNQNAQGDLYVYTNKKNLRDKEGELSAFLHLDLEHLGATDVSVKMLGKKVDTKFYLSDETAYQLILEHAGLLEEQLEKKGYHCKVNVENEEKKTDFVSDFLMQGRPVGGALHRYSFDMRA